MSNPVNEKINLLTIKNFILTLKKIKVDVIPFSSVDAAAIIAALFVSSAGENKASMLSCLKSGDFKKLWDLHGVSLFILSIPAIFYSVSASLRKVISMTEEYVDLELVQKVKFTPEGKVVNIKYHKVTFELNAKLDELYKDLKKDYHFIDFSDFLNYAIGTENGYKYESDEFVELYERLRVSNYDKLLNIYDLIREQNDLINSMWRIYEKYAKEL